MGQYLCIGINTKIEVERAELQCCRSGEDGARTIIEQELADRELYDLTVTDDLLIYSLKAEAVEEEWCAFIKDFYEMRYRETETRMEYEAALEAISAGTTLEDWLSLAARKLYRCYRTDAYWSSVDIGSFYPCRLRVENIMLSIDGKILMECYDDLFRFFLNCIRKRLEQYKLADALAIYIFG